MGESWGYAGYGRNDDARAETPMEYEARHRRIEEERRLKRESLQRGELGPNYLALADRVSGYYGDHDGAIARRAIIDWLLEQL